MSERPFRVAIAGGFLDGHESLRQPETSSRRCALILHGGPGLPDYMDGCAAELAGLFETVRYTQRGTAPSTGDGPFSVESHMDDALAVLDSLELDRVWLVGHSWGGHLALHLAVAHPERLCGIVCVATLGASAEVLPDFDANLFGGLSEDDRRKVQIIDEQNEAGAATEAELLEQLRIIWARYFADPASATPFSIEHIGVECGAGTHQSVGEHFARRTLELGLPSVRLPVLFVHGADDPLPSRASVETAHLIPGAVATILPGCGHFPWLERPGALCSAVEALLAQ